jgi:hypothetical protein
MARHPSRILVGFLLIFLIGPFWGERTLAGHFPAGRPHQGNTYYVAPGGDDGNPGTIDFPWQTIQHAADTLVAGDTVYIRAGTHPEQVVPQNSGAAGQYITYAAYPGEVVTLDGADVTLPDDLVGLFGVSNRDYIRVAGLHVVNAGPYVNNMGILTTDSSYVVIENNSTYHALSAGIGAFGGDHVIIHGNEVELACLDIWQECPSVADVDTFEVRYNEVRWCTGGIVGVSGKEH